MLLFFWLWADLFCLGNSLKIPKGLSEALISKKDIQHNSQNIHIKLKTEQHELHLQGTGAKLSCTRRVGSLTCDWHQKLKIIETTIWGKLLQNFFKLQSWCMTGPSSHVELYISTRKSNFANWHLMNYQAIISVLMKWKKNIPHCKNSFKIQL